MPFNTQVIPFESVARSIVSGGTAATFESSVQQNLGWRGVRLILNISAALGESKALDVKLQTKDPVSGAWIDIPGAAFAQKSATGTDDLIVYPAVAETANRSVSDVISGEWRALATVAATAAAADTGTLTSSGTNPGAGGTITLGSRVYTLVAALTEAFARSALVGDGTNAVNNSTVTIGSDVYTYKTALTETRASVTLTSDATNPDDGGTITLGYGQYQTTYTLKTTLGTDQNQIKIGVSAAATLDNIKAAINASGTPGTEYSAVMQHPQIEATTNTNTTQLFQGRIGSSFQFDGGNILVSTETATHLSFGSVVFVGGVASVPKEVTIGADDDGSLSNLANALNADVTNRGTTYSYATTVNSSVSASVVTNTLTAVARTLGTSPNTLATLASTSPDSHQDWADTTLGGGTGASDPGVNAVANEILIGASAAATLDNIKSAINGTAGAGTTYSTGTVAHTQIDATTNTDTTQVFASKSSVSHAVADALATTETATELSFGATTLGGGGDAGSFTFSLGGNYFE